MSAPPTHPHRPPGHRPAPRWAVVALVWLLCGSSRGHAHGDAHQLIADLNRQLEARPRDAALHFRRGELHRLDGNWTSALADLNRAAELDPTLAAVDLERGRVFLEAGQPERATNALNRFLAAHPTNSIARVTRARAFAWLGQPRAAIDDFTAAIQASPGAGPDLYLERAAACRAFGPQGLQEALQGLETAITHIGPVVTLESAALDLETELKLWDAALRRLDRMMEKASRRDRWLIRRAELLEAAGRADDARRSWVEARREFEGLPERMRQTPAGKQEAERLRKALDGAP